MAYTYGGNKTKSTNPNLASNFSVLQVDGGRNAMTGVLGNQMQSKDATASPVTSPITNGSGSGIVITVPQRGAQFTIFSSVTTLVGEDSTFTFGFTVPASVIWTFDCANMQFIYLKPSSGTNIIQFYFNMV